MKTLKRVFLHNSIAKVNTQPRDWGTWSAPIVLSSVCISVFRPICNAVSWRHELECFIMIISYDIFVLSLYFVLTATVMNNNWNCYFNNHYKTIEINR